MREPLRKCQGCGFPVLATSIECKTCDLLGPAVGEFDYDRDGPTLIRRAELAAIA